MLKVQEIRELIELIDQSSISEFTYESEGTTVSIKKQSEQSSVINEQTSPTFTVQKSTDVKVESKPRETNEGELTEKVSSTSEVNTDYDYEIVSPMVGTFYTATSPENDPFVLKGSKVENDSVVCISDKNLRT